MGLIGKLILRRALDRTLQVATDRVIVKGLNKLSQPLTTQSKIDKIIETSDKTGKTTPPHDSEWYIGKDYLEAINSLRTAGFTNITQVPMNNIKREKSKKIGKVEKIMIKKLDKFAPGYPWKKDVKIKIYYNSLKEKRIKSNKG